jgi:hypothetical protein
MWCWSNLSISQGIDAVLFAYHLCGLEGFRLRILLHHQLCPETDAVCRWRFSDGMFR